MRMIHTADWHLGKSLKGMSLLEDQQYILGEFLKLVDDSAPEAVIIAGDIYDRAVPPTEAVELFDEILTKLLLEKKIPVLYISGNHDSAVRLHFGSRLLSSAGLFVRGELTEDPAPVILEDEAGPVYFSLIPYLEPAKAAAVFGRKERLDFEAAHALVLDRARAAIPKGKRSVAVAHAFLAGGVPSESERPLSVGGSDSVSPGLFRDFCYTALGHLHGPQRAGAESIRYSGSPLKYSFDEASQKKGVTLVELDAGGSVRTEHLPLTPRRDVRIVEGQMAELRTDRERYPVSEDYVLARLRDTEPVLNAREKLEAVYPNLLAVERVGMFARTELRQPDGRRENRSEQMLFRDFYEEMTQEKLNEAQEKILEECILKAREREGESA